ncbi:hypothetical protein KQI84_04550 [bacterium]|nr:hypothetical protein [bacterium]
MRGRPRYSDNGNPWTDFRTARPKLPKAGIRGAFLLGILLAPIGMFVLVVDLLPVLFDSLVFDHPGDLEPIGRVAAIGAALGFLSAFIIWEWRTKDES